MKLIWTQEGEGYWVGRNAVLRNPVEVEYDGRFGAAPYFVLAGRLDQGLRPYASLTGAKIAASRIADFLPRKA
jgi:hypothetical protein